MDVPNINLDVYAGSTFTQVFQWLQADNITPVDLMGVSVHSQWRTSVTDTAVLCDLSTTNNRITVDSSTGTISLYITAADTAGFSFSNAVYDIQVKFPANASGDIPVLPFCKGKVKVTQEITRV